MEPLLGIPPALGAPLGLAALLAMPFALIWLLDFCLAKRFGADVFVLGYVACLAAGVFAGILCVTLLVLLT